MTFFKRMCLSELCQAGTRWSMCLQSVALPSSLHLLHASSTLKVLKMGSCCEGKMVSRAYNPRQSQFFFFAMAACRTCVSVSFILMSLE
jgi:hypothetical protein